MFGMTNSGSEGGVRAVAQDYETIYGGRVYLFGWIEGVMTGVESACVLEDEVEGLEKFVLSVTRTDVGLEES